MPTEEDLRAALASGVSFLYPDVDEELDRVLSRATVRSRTRLASYAAGLAAVVALVLLLVGQDWRPHADGPQPSRQDEVPVRGLPSGVGRYDNPFVLRAGRWNVDFLPDSWPHRVEAVIDVPEGWGQDDRFALATGPGGRPTTRRLDFFAGRQAALAQCPAAGLGPRPTTLEVARALGSVTAMTSTDPEPVTVGGHPGWFVELHDPLLKRVPQCKDPDSVLLTVPGLVCRAPGFTTLAWVLDVDGRTTAVYGSYGPAVTPAETEELVRMVETSQITVR